VRSDGASADRERYAGSLRLRSVRWGTVAAAVLLLESATVAPPAGAAPAERDCAGGRISARDSRRVSDSDDKRRRRRRRKRTVSESRSGCATVSREMVTVVDAATALVLTVTLRRRSGCTVTLEGTVAAVVLC